VREAGSRSTYISLTVCLCVPACLSLVCLSVWELSPCSTLWMSTRSDKPSICLPSWIGLSEGSHRQVPGNAEQRVQPGANGHASCIAVQGIQGRRRDREDQQGTHPRAALFSVSVRPTVRLAVGHSFRPFIRSALSGVVSPIVLFNTQTRTFEPYLTANKRILMSVNGATVERVACSWALQLMLAPGMLSCSRIVPSIGTGRLAGRLADGPRGKYRDLAACWLPGRWSTWPRRTGASESGLSVSSAAASGGASRSRSRSASRSSQLSAAASSATSSSWMRCARGESVRQLGDGQRGVCAGVILHAANGAMLGGGG
jgi:hypothetical protein